MKTHYDTFLDRKTNLFTLIGDKRAVQLCHVGALGKHNFLAVTADQFVYLIGNREAFFVTF